MWARKENVGSKYEYLELINDLNDLWTKSKTWTLVLKRRFTVLETRISKKMKMFSTLKLKRHYLSTRFHCLHNLDFMCCQEEGVFHALIIYTRLFWCLFIKSFWDLHCFVSLFISLSVTLKSFTFKWGVGNWENSQENMLCI